MNKAGDHLVRNELISGWWSLAVRGSGSMASAVCAPPPGISAVTPADDALVLLYTGRISTIGSPPWILERPPQRRDREIGM